METVLKITKHKFTTDDGELKEYYRFRAKIDDEWIDFFPKPEYKKLLNYLLRTFEIPLEED